MCFSFLKVLLRLCENKHVRTYSIIKPHVICPHFQLVLQIFSLLSISSVHDVQLLNIFFLAPAAHFFPHFLVPLCDMSLLGLNGGLGRIVQLSPVASAASRAPVGHLGEQRGSADAAVRVLFLELGVHFVAEGEAVHKILEEVTAEDHVYPRVAAAVETGKERRQSHCCVLRIWRKKREERGKG